MIYTTTDILELARVIKQYNPSLSGKRLIETVKNEIKILAANLANCGEKLEIKGD